VALGSAGYLRRVDLAESDSGGHSDLRVGDDVVLELAENPSTGYRWHLAAGTDPLEPTGDDYRAATGRAGAPGVRRFQFRATQPGPARLKIEKRRSWETTPVAEFSYQVDVLA
jgi:inhibitor of cysteine peptidase